METPAQREYREFQDRRKREWDEFRARQKAERDEFLARRRLEYEVYRAKSVPNLKRDAPQWTFGRRFRPPRN